MYFKEYGNHFVYGLQGLYLEFEPVSRTCIEVFLSKNRGADLSPDKRWYIEGLDELRDTINTNIKSPYKIFEAITLYFADYSDVVGSKFNYREVEEFATLITTRRDPQIPYYAQKVMHYIAYDIYGELDFDDDYLETISDDAINSWYRGVDEEGFEIYECGSLIKVADGKIEEGVDMSWTAKKFVIDACMYYLNTFLEDARVVFQKNRMEIYVGNATFLYRFEDTTVVYSTKQSHKCNYEPVFRINESVDTCIDFVDSVFAHVQEMLGGRTKGDGMDIF